MTTKILTVLFLSIILSACSLFPQTNQTTTNPNTPASPTSPVKKDVYTSIKDAVGKQIALKCQYTDNGQTTTTYIKGQTVRLIGTGEQAGVEGLMKDNKFYLWNTKDKKGMILDLSKMDGAKMGDTPVKNVNDVVTALEKKKDNCSVSYDSEAMFNLPSDVAFSTAPDIFNSTK